MNALLAEIIGAIVTALLPFLEHLAREPDTILDAAPPDPALQKGLDDELSQAIADGTAPAP